ncbi:hypothetical protein JGUZn3_13560 [Entomobacter blattae]|uniref:Uncharacterized protein n=1 Tax=Entomobacter blattae TaxID=2762277 RepID=A0A7H1NS22_9PROT|nr:hypothetical protein JGUZn3_13560 [Entomobacter blattae]
MANKDCISHAKSKIVEEHHYRFFIFQINFSLFKMQLSKVQLNDLSKF